VSGTGKRADGKTDAQRAGIKLSLF
jgi:hypothetical protein